MTKRSEYQTHCLERIEAHFTDECEKLQLLEQAMKRWGDTPLCAKCIAPVLQAFQALRDLREMLLSCDEYDDDFSLMLTFTLNKRRQIYAELRPLNARLLMVLKARGNA